MFYKHIPEPKIALDIEPLHPHVMPFSSTAMPIINAQVGSVMFDPPFLTYVKKGRDHKDGKVAMTARFGGYYSYDELQTHYIATIKESARILRRKGVLIVKCQDIIHNHRMHCTHYNIIIWAQEWFRLKDLFVLGAKSRMPGPQRGTQRHARVFHSYFLVLERL